MIHQPRVLSIYDKSKAASTTSTIKSSATPLIFSPFLEITLFTFPEAFITPTLKPIVGDTGKVKVNVLVIT